MAKRMRVFDQGEPLPKWREDLHEIIFEADTPLGKAFDVSLIVMITLSVVVVMLESVSKIKAQYGFWLDVAEWSFTLLFTVEYILRLLCVRKPLRYARSFFGVVDLASILPSYISLVFPGAETLLVIRVLRGLRIFRIFKLGEYMGEANVMMRAFQTSRKKILVFLYTIFIFVVIFGSIMYLVEGEEGGFTSIPRSVYWAIVTMTTVGYGDIAPQTDIGQIIAAGVMICGYAIIAVPTGIYSTELAKAYRETTNNACINCGEEGHDSDADYCKYCGEKL